MNGLEAPWIGRSFYINIYKYLLNIMFNNYLVKNNKFIIFLNIYLYFYLFNFLRSSKLLKINTIIDIVAIHYPDNIQNEFEFLYVNLNYKLNLRFFLKLLINKENIM